jgi:hypothetical protein
MDLNFLKRGTAAVKELENPAFVPGSGGKVFRFYLKKDQNAMLTFLDGAMVPLSETGGEMVFDVPGAYEHSFMVDGRVADFICTMEREGTCPLCYDKKNRYYSLFFSVIDHRKNVSAQGRVYEYNKRILAVGKDSYKRLLMFLAEHINPEKGMVGLQISALKTATKSSQIGDFFKFKSYVNLQDLASQGIDVTPLDFSKELVYRDVASLEGLGYGMGDLDMGISSRGKSVATSLPAFDDDVPF